MCACVTEDERKKEDLFVLLFPPRPARVGGEAQECSVSGGSFTFHNFALVEAHSNVYMYSPLCLVLAMGSYLSLSSRGAFISRLLFICGYD